MAAQHSAERLVAPLDKARPSTSGLELGKAALQSNRVGTLRLAAGGEVFLDVPSGRGVVCVKDSNVSSLASTVHRSCEALGRKARPQVDSGRGGEYAGRNMPKKRIARNAALLVSLIGLAGGGASAAPEATTAPAKAEIKPEAKSETKDEGKVVGPPEVAWKDLNAEQRARYMKAVVVPKMKVAFQAFDADHFKNFTCSTCHGKDGKANKYKMPSSGIRALPSTPAAFEAAMKKEPTWPKMAKFMAETVVPQMAALLGKPAFDHHKPDPSAFSCQGCHRLEKK